MVDVFLLDKYETHLIIRDYHQDNEGFPDEEERESSETRLYQVFDKKLYAGMEI